MQMLCLFYNNDKLLMKDQFPADPAAMCQGCFETLDRFEPNYYLCLNICLN